ncbi:MAG: glycosyl hydrolase family 28 protein [Tepidisphaeraceae bacterium]|jgi:polygalacturonase
MPRQPAIFLSAILMIAASSAAQAVDPAPANIPDRDFSLLDFGGVGDGKTLNTNAFASAVKAIAAAGGGRLIVPKGSFLTLPFALVSRMDLHLDDGAVIRFPSDVTAYGLSPRPTPNQMKTLKDRYPALIIGTDLADVAITGAGIIDGAGAAWWNLTVTDNQGRTHADGEAKPKLIVLSNVHRVHVQGVTLRNSPRYHLVLRQCRDCLVEGAHLISPSDSPHTDGIDPISSDTVVIRDCDLDVGDDDVAVKALDGPAANVLVENCRCAHGRGISIGSETYQGIHDVTVRNCTFTGTLHGIHVKSARDRGNQLYAFHFSNIAMKDVSLPLSINLYYQDRQGQADRASLPLTATTPFVHDIEIDGLTATGAANAGEIIGLPESPLKRVTLTNVSIVADKGMIVTDAQGVMFKNVRIDTLTGPPLVSNHADVSWDRSPSASQPTGAGSTRPDIPGR